MDGSMCGNAKKIGFVLMLTLLLIWPLQKGSFAKIPAGIPCSSCHTMHYSQNGGVLEEWGKHGPYKALVINDCIGCHTGNNDGTNFTPYVTSTSPPNYGETGTEGNTLAGGSFYWVSIGEEKKGHNVVPFPPDSRFGNTPPGGPGLTSQLTCAGTTGCHGDRNKEGDFEALLGAHHADDSTIDGQTVGTSYRFLKGILGYEDSDWEYQPDASHHNQYKGTDRSSEAQVNTTTISYLCAECHGFFHSGDGISGQSTGWGSPWLRHPTDYDMSNTASGSEYRAYPGNYAAPRSTGTNPYSVIAPLGSEDVSAPKTNILFQGQDAIVTCISCHRAHGSPYNAILRWDYYGWPQTTTKNGCNACHTNKD